MLNNKSLAVKFTLLFLLLLAVLGGSYFLILRNIYLAQLQSEARTISDNVNAFGKWVSQYGRVWVRDNDRSYLGKLAVLPLPEESAAAAAPSAGAQPTTHFYSKNPALAQREFSEVVAASPAPAKFRMTSDSVMNPNNAPDDFERAALARVKSGKLTEYGSLEPGGVYRYVRTLYHEKSCIGCHGARDAAPADVLARYGRGGGFDFKEGDVAGVISVTIPARSLFATTIGVISGLEIVLVIAAFGIAVLFFKRAVIDPVQRLTLAANRTSVGESVDLGTAALPPRSRNEIHQLAFALERLRTSMALAIQRMKASQHPPG